MKYIKKFEMNNNTDTDFYLEVTSEVAFSYCNGNPLPSTDPIPLNTQVLEYAFGIPSDGATDRDYEEVAEDACEWFDGTIESIKNSVNAVNEFDYASEGPDFVLGVNYDGESAEFGNLHVFLKDCKQVKVVFVYDCKKEKFYKPNFFKKLYSTPGLYNNIDKFNL